ncbi:MAG TPA: HEAT repeat domain-containing protein [Gemmatimonadaceae bacterium]|nr:HEAT repeat domain-containing protein [Gemmatimonadaceae bacterium]
MDRAPNFASNLGSLVWLLVHRPDSKAEQKAALRAAVAKNRSQDVLLDVETLNVQLHEEEALEGGSRVHELSARMSAHSVRQLRIAAGTKPAKLLALAQALAADPLRGDDGESFDARFQEIDAAGITATIGRGSFVRVATPAAGADTVQAVRTTTLPRALPAYGGRTPSHGVDTTEPGRPPSLSAPRVHGLTPGSGITAVREPEPRGVGEPPQPVAPRISDDTRGMVEAAIVTPTIGAADADELLARIDAALPAGQFGKALDQLVSMAESYAAQQRWEAMSAIYHGVVVREARVGDTDARRPLAMAVRRLTKPSFLREIARLLPRHPDQRDGLQAILVRAGDEGAEALIELLTSADSMTDRRAYLAALLPCQAAVPTLMHLLGDQRWYVARNAADLLGEMQVAAAEQPLAELLHHPDERVRRAVGAALARIGSPRALHSASQALGDASSEVRAHVAAALGATRHPRAVAGIVRALDEEPDPETASTMLAALGRAGTPDAVEHLIAVARETGGLFRRRKLAARRTAAVLALAEAATPAALAVVDELAADREPEVRDAARRSLAARRPVSAP